MTWAVELVKIRRYLRDPNGNIWSEAFLRHLYNDVQQDFQHRTKVLEGVVAQRVPQVYQWSYQQDWEYRFLPTTETQFYQCLNQHDDYVFCHRWEPQQITGLAPDVADYGVHGTQAWEIYTSETSGDVLRMRFPADFNSVKFIAYDEKPLLGMSKKQIQSTDPSWMKHEGIPFAYYMQDQSDDSYGLYPRPSASFVNELSGEGVAQSAEDDTEDTSTGLIATRTGSFDDGVGVPVDIVDVTNSVFLVYGVSPQSVNDDFDEPAFPEFLRKYIRYGTISRAYGGNNDGRIRSLADYWMGRYMLGVEFVKRYVRNRRNDRDYRLTTKGSVPGRTVRHPRLPDTYPAV
jgi:hypothetical protein